MQVSESLDKPHSLPYHGTVKNHHFRQYLFEDIMTDSPGERLLILVLSYHPYWREYIDVIKNYTALPHVIQGILSFW